MGHIFALQSAFGSEFYISECVLILFLACQMQSIFIHECKTASLIALFILKSLCYYKIFRPMLQPHDITIPTDISNPKRLHFLRF